MSDRTPSEKAKAIVDSWEWDDFTFLPSMRAKMEASIAAALEEARDEGYQQGIKDESESHRCED